MILTDFKLSQCDTHSSYENTVYEFDLFFIHVAVNFVNVYVDLILNHFFQIMQKDTISNLEYSFVTKMKVHVYQRKCMKEFCSDCCGSQWRRKTALAVIVYWLLQSGTSVMVPQYYMLFCPLVYRL